MNTGRDLLLWLWKRKSQRDLQKTIGASEFGSPCTYCVGQILLANHKHDGHSPWWLAARIGTACHLDLQHVAEELLPKSMLEHRVYLGELPDYGVISSSLDYFDPDEGHLVDWKGLALDTELPTPSGWTTMADVQEGDYLLGPDGLPTRVVAKSEVHYNPTYRITFDDGTSVVADHEHRWLVRVGPTTNYRDYVWTTEEILKRGLRGRRGRGQRDVRIMNTAPLAGVEQDLPIDPYVLGVWLGDGSSDSGVIHSGNHETRVWDEIRRRGYEVSHDLAPNRGAQSRTVYGLSTQLRALNLLGNKHLPMQYLRAKEHVRRDVLAGLLDADGHYNNLRNRVDMQTTHEWQAWAVYDLAVSLGWTANVHSITTQWQGGSKPAWMVSFSPDEDVFLVRNQGKHGGGSRSRRRLIKSIEQVDTVTTQCLQVDNESHMYLCTRALLPTHNTTERSKLRLYKLIEVMPDPSSIETTELSEARFTLEKYVNQGLSYARGLVMAGYEVNRISLGFVCRDGKTDDDIWSLDFDYDPEQAQRVWDRLVALWDYLREGGDPEALNKHPYCQTCSRR